MKLWDRLTNPFRPTTNPETGDPLTGGEHFSWFIQRIMRRWAFLGVVTGITILCWTTRNDNVLNWWNLGASYLALVIESIVGMAMFKQTVRDAVVIRETRTMSRHLEQLTELLLIYVKQIEQQELQREDTP